MHDMTLRQAKDEIAQRYCQGDGSQFQNWTHACLHDEDFRIDHADEVAELYGKSMFESGAKAQRGLIAEGAEYYDLSKDVIMAAPLAKLEDLRELKHGDQFPLPEGLELREETIMPEGWQPSYYNPDNSGCEQPAEPVKVFRIVRAEVKEKKICGQTCGCTDNSQCQFQLSVKPEPESQEERSLLDRIKDEVASDADYLDWNQIEHDQIWNAVGRKLVNEVATRYASACVKEREEDIKTRLMRQWNKLDAEEIYDQI